MTLRITIETELKKKIKYQQVKSEGNTQVLGLEIKNQIILIKLGNYNKN